MFDYDLQPGKELKKVEYDGSDVLVTIITSVYYGEYLEQTANCILNQTFPYFEWIIVNDGSKDETTLKNLQKVKSLDKRIKVYEKENEGQAVARDFAAEKANKNSKYFVFIDDDDLIDNNYLEMLYYTLEVNKDASWAYTDIVNFGAKKLVWKNHFDCELMKNENLLTITAMIRKEAFFSVNGFNVKEKKMYEDWNMWLKMIAQGRYPVHISTNSFWYRIKTNGELTKSKKNNRKANKMIKDTVKTITKNVDAIEYPRETYNWDMILRNSVVVPKLKTKKINILFIFPWMVLGGADKFNLDLIGSLDKEKYSVTVVTTQQTEYRWKQKFESISDSVFELPAFLDRKDWPAFLEYLIKSRNINIIFNSNSCAGYAMLPYLKSLFPEIPILDYIHMEEWYNRNGGYSRDTYGVSSVIDKTYFCNKNSENILIDHFGINRKKIETVYIGVDTEEFNPKKYNKEELLIKYKVPKDKTIINFVARIDYQKRPYLFINIVEKLVQVNKDVYFLVAGDGPLLKKIKKYAKKKKVNKYINFLGKSDTPSEIYMVSDLSLNCSIKEGLALTSYESLALGIPVVSSDVGGQKELITDKVGVIVPCLQNEEDAFTLEYSTEEIDNYVTAIQKVIKKLDKYKKECRQHIVHNFNIKSMYKKFDEEFEKFAKEKSKCKYSSDNLDIARELYVQYLVASKDTNDYLNRQYNLTVYKEEKPRNIRFYIKHISFPNFDRLERFFVKHHLANEFYIVVVFLINFFELFKNIYKCTIGFVISIIIQIFRRLSKLFKRIFRKSA